LKPTPGLKLSPGPYRALDDGTILAADGHVVCVLGCPEEGLTEQDVTNAAVLLVLPELIETLADLACKASGATVYLPPGDRADISGLVERSVGLVRRARFGSSR
jgi:hypothetical protein